MKKEIDYVEVIERNYIYPSEIRASKILFGSFGEAHSTQEDLFRTAIRAGDIIIQLAEDIKKERGVGGEEE